LHDNYHNQLGTLDEAPENDNFSRDAPRWGWQPHNFPFGYEKARLCDEGAAAQVALRDIYQATMHTNRHLTAFRPWLMGADSPTDTMRRHQDHLRRVQRRPRSASPKKKKFKPKAKR
jgi:hypothetical protein